MSELPLEYIVEHGLKEDAKDTTLDLLKSMMKIIY